ncbi:hypothetical protein HNQ41_000096 [Texcoconibacillus texcoconensis]|uniref:Uncharacterized protein n=1 Tax=Texcoconibacillus texcoconensis TaxID=1095777 RepID=A0A840QKE5_9BACI|nr:hypothetical protein [Texcoconibacillus texcoconensis]
MKQKKNSYESNENVSVTGTFFVCQKINSYSEKREVTNLEIHIL